MRRGRRSGAVLTSMARRKPNAARMAHRGAFSLIAAAAVLATVTTPIARQDVSGLLLSSLTDRARWSASLSEGPGGETRLVTEPMAEMRGPAATVTAGGGRIVVDGVDPLVTGSIGAADPRPDEERLDRSWKGDLPATLTRPATAPGFSAGSIYPEHSRLQPPAPGSGPILAFVPSSELPRTVLAVARFTRPRANDTAVAELGPMPQPHARPNTPTLVAAGDPVPPISPASTPTPTDPVVAAYAPNAPVVDQDAFAGLFAMPREKPEQPAEVVGPGDHWWARLVLPSAIYSAAEQTCLAEAVYFEARGEPYRGQLAVAQTVLNRVRNPAYPDTVCGVVYQNKGVRNACQFSFACDGIKDVIGSRKAWHIARKAAREVSFQGARVAEVGTSTHYHATYVKPNWASVFIKKARIGKHIFYQTINGGWS